MTNIVTVRYFNDYYFGRFLSGLAMVKQRAYSKYAKEAAFLLGQQIKLGRKNRQWSEQNLAERAGISRATLQKIEAGEMSMPKEGEIPFVKPGHSMSETTGDWAANVGKADEIASNGSVDESQKWGRTKRPRERR